MSFQTPLARVRGLGSAKNGTSHFMKQRASAIALLMLSIWFLWAVTCFVGQSYEEVITWIAQPLHVLPFLLFVGTALFHARLGLQVVIEDYVHCDKAKLLLVILVNFLAYGLFSLFAFALLKIAFVGTGNFAG